MFGTASLTTMVTVAVSVPPEFVAVIVYTINTESVVEVPEITPVLVSKLIPVGSVGDIDQDVTAPPLLVGVTVDIATSLVKVNEFGE